MVVNPNTTASMTAAVVAGARAVAGPGTEVVGATPSRGVASVESHVDELWGAVGVLEAVLNGERTGVDGYVIACFGDTGLLGAREAATGPVVGMTEAALYTAAMIAHRFSIITMPLRTMEQAERVVRAVGLGHRCTVRAVGRQDGCQVGRRVIGLIDEPVVALGGGPVAFGHGAKRLPRLRGLHARAVHQPLAQAFIAQHRSTELLARPGLALQTLPGLHCDQAHGLRHPHARAKVRLQRVHADGLDGLRALMIAVLAPAPLGLAHGHPVGGLVAGAGEDVAVDEALDQPGPVLVLVLEVLAHAAQRHPQHHRGQVVAAH